MIKTTCLFLLCLATALRADDTAAKLEAMSRDFLDLGLFRGAILVVQKDNVLVDRGYGPADAESAIANTPDTRFRIASMTKWFTAAAVMDLVAEGRLALDTPVTKFLPEAPPAWAAIQLSHLLMHTSGLPNFTDFPDFHASSTKSFTPVELLGLFKAHPLAFAPGAKFSYTNSGYVLLGLIIERVTGEDYGAYMHRRYFTPLGLKDTTYTSSADFAPGMAIGYVPTASGPRRAPPWHLSTAYAAGGLVSTTGDLRRWFDTLRAAKVGKPEDWAMLKVERVDYREMGLTSAWAGGKRILAASGAIPGFLSNLVYDTSSDTLIVVLANIGGAGGEDLIKKLLHIVQGGNPELPSARKGIALPAETLARYAGTYRMAAGFPLVIVLADGRLHAQAPGQAPVELVAISESLFEAKALDGSIEFARDAEGNVAQIVLTRGGRKIPGAPER